MIDDVSKGLKKFVNTRNIQRHNSVATITRKYTAYKNTNLKIYASNKRALVSDKTKALDLFI